MIRPSNSFLSDAFYILNVIQCIYFCWRRKQKLERTWKAPKSNDNECEKFQSWYKRRRNPRNIVEKLRKFENFQKNTKHFKELQDIKTNAKTTLRMPERIREHFNEVEDVLQIWDSSKRTLNIQKGKTNAKTKASKRNWEQPLEQIQTIAAHKEKKFIGNAKGVKFLRRSYESMFIAVYFVNDVDFLLILFKKSHL